jgi:hypothetical protein
MGWPVEGSFVALKELSTSLSDSIDDHYVAQCVALASNSVVQSVYEDTEASFFTAKNAANKRHVRRNRAYQFVFCVGLRDFWS